MSYPVRRQRQWHDASGEQRLISVGDLEDDPGPLHALAVWPALKIDPFAHGFSNPSKQEIASGKSRKIHHLDLEICKAVAIDVTRHYPTPEVKFTCFAVERTAADK
jgi:hypothetical protein